MNTNLIRIYPFTILLKRFRKYRCEVFLNRVNSDFDFNRRTLSDRSCQYLKYGDTFLKPHLCSWSAHLKLLRGIHTSAVKSHGEYEWQDPKSEEEVVTVQILDRDGKAHNIRGKVGDNLLYLAKRFEVEMEGACEASLACTTCHVYVDHDFLDILPEATETEEDLLDQAPFLKENSRLGCQIILSKELEGLKLKLPAATKNFYVDGHKPTPH